MSVVIWHNPRCSKSRSTLSLLEERGIEPEVRRYLEDAPSKDELKEVLALLGIDAIDLVRTGEADFKETRLARDSDAMDLITAMSERPKLIERPIVIANGKARIGRPPEAVLDIL